MEKQDKDKEKQEKKPNEKTEKKDEAEETKLTAEEEELKKNIQDMVNGLLDPEFQIKQNAFNLLKKEITTSTGSMTSIPKPLKFFQLHYERLKQAYETEKKENLNSPTQKLYGDLLCILVLVIETKETSLQYVLENELRDFPDWGQELVRSLSGEITTEYLKRLDETKPFDDLLGLVGITANALIASHNESEAIDLLIELDLIDDIKNYCTDINYKKFCWYLTAISNYAAESSEQKKILGIVFELYTKYNEYTNALRVAIKLKEKMFIQSTISSCPNKSTRLQMAFILARSNVYFESKELEPELLDIIKNLKTSEYFKMFGRSLDIAQPKHPEDIFKSHLEEKKEGIQLESYKMNMSTSIASSFINAGFGTECLFSGKRDGKKEVEETSWLNKNKEEGLLCAIAGLGLVNIWDIDCGFNEIEKYMDVNEMNPHKRGGYNLAIGILSSGVVDENTSAIALLSEQTKDKKYVIYLLLLILFNNFLFFLF